MKNRNEILKGKRLTAGICAVLLIAGSSVGLMKTFSEKNSGSQEDETHTEVTSPKKDETISAGGTVSSSQLEATLGIKNSSAKITVEEVLVSSGESVSEGTELYNLTDEKDIRKKHISVPILMLTARSEIEDKVRGLDSGADYYLTKPFDSRELLATVNALLRWLGTQVNELVFGNTHLDLESAELACDNNSVSLSAREFEVMRLLMISGKNHISKESLLTKVCGYDSNAVENHVEVYVGFLRKKLSSIGSDIHIEAVRRLGYHLECEG